MPDTLYDSLKKYCSGDFYPFHMPGHKRNQAFGKRIPAAETDITEIDGFDNLHHPEGILRQMQEKAARLYGSCETFVSVNGSTAGLLSAISAAVRPGGEILAARNCHRAVYHAICLRSLKPYYVYPQWNPQWGLNGGIMPKDVDNILKRHRKIQAAVITSPTYDGMVSDVEAIARVVHGYGIPLIVDEAHGAHFAFSEKFPRSALELGADAVIQSVHKTLPSLTQTALLHRGTERIDRERLSRFMGMYQSSSPSYVLMGAVDTCLDILEDQGLKLFEAYVEELERARRALSQLKHIQVPGRELCGTHGVYDVDISKIIFSVKDCTISGRELHQRFRERFHLEMEMDADSYVLALSSVGDTKQGFERLVRAAFELDGELKDKERSTEREIPSLSRMKQRILPWEAMEQEAEPVALRESEGRISVEFVYLYPPGIPLAVPGEEISGQFVESLSRYQRMGFELQGMRDYTGERIWVLK
ncbi:MAG: aminotransferase class I/II-fold pyridoxal phosphate-dependent enzyme [Eubacteriales bacterium]|nr:aminotransferase class I/II-fold pyridoxal phosphate-dependent enzyme [Eubacteriales bacterium]